MNRLLSSHIFLFAVLLLFIILKIPYLHLPFYWDESWVYGPAVTFMSENGPGLLPDALPVEYGRGHPLLFHFSGGCWGSIFGTSLVSLHIFALTISIALLISVYHITKQIFNARAALIAVIIVCAQPLFFAQSVLVLPEILLAVFMLWALWAYIQNKKIPYIVFASLAILVKESGIVVPITLMLFETVEYFRKKESVAKWLRSEIILASPLLFFGFILLLNHAYFGWYIFPEHSGSISTSVVETWKKLGDGYFAFLFIYQGRNIFSAILIILSLVFIIKKWKIELSRSVQLFGLYMILFLIFSSLNFYSNRYILLLVILFCVLIAGAVTSVNLPVYTGWIVCLIGITVGIIEMRKPNKNDYHPGYSHYVKAQKQMVDWCVKNNFQHKPINCTFLVKHALQNYRAGYLHKEQSFTRVSSEPDTTAEIIIYGNNEDTLGLSQLANSSKYRLIHVAKNGAARFVVYKKVSW